MLRRTRRGSCIPVCQLSRTLALYVRTLLLQLLCDARLRGGVGERHCEMRKHIHYATLPVIPRPTATPREDIYRKTYTPLLSTSGIRVGR